MVGPGLRPGRKENGPVDDVENADMNKQPTRKSLPHDVPQWVNQGVRHFVSFNCQVREANILCLGNRPQSLLDSVRYYETLGRWYIWLWLIMPDHLHGIITFDLNTGIRKTISTWKGYTTKSCKLQWQRNFFEHRLRNEDEFVEKASYIRMNPVRRGLCERPEDWPWQLDRTDLDCGRARPPAGPEDGPAGGRPLPDAGC